MASTLEKLPTPAEIHAELLATLKRAESLRKLMRLSQRVEKECGQTPVAPRAEKTSEAPHS